MPFVLADFIWVKAMRLEGQTPARTWTQFESSLPAGKIEPVSVEVKENDTKVEGMAVFECLVKMS